MKQRDLPDLLTGWQVARYLGVGRHVVYRWLQEGRLPGTKVGRRWVIHRRALVRWLRRS